MRIVLRIKNVVPSKSRAQQAGHRGEEKKEDISEKGRNCDTFPVALPPFLPPLLLLTLGIIPPVTVPSCLSSSTC